MSRLMGCKLQNSGCTHIHDYKSRVMLGSGVWRSENHTSLWSVLGLRAQKAQSAGVKGVQCVEINDM